MKSLQTIRWLFFVAAFYDGLLGLLFIFSPLAPYAWFDVTPPNHLGYVQFPAALLLVFAFIFLQIARDPQSHYDLIIYGIMLKTAYCSVVFWYWASAGVPVMWKPFALCDLLFLILFVWSYLTLKRT